MKCFPWEQLDPLQTERTIYSSFQSLGFKSWNHLCFLFVFFFLFDIFIFQTVPGRVFLILYVNVVMCPGHNVLWLESVGEACTVAHFTTSSETEVVAELIIFMTGREQAMLPKEWADTHMCEPVFVCLHRLASTDPDTLPLGIISVQIVSKDVRGEVSVLCLESCFCLRLDVLGTASHCRNPALLNSSSAIPQLTPFASVGRGEVALPPHGLFLL